MAEIREGLRARLDTITGLQASAYLLSNPTPPCAEIQPGEIEYDRAMARGMDGTQMTVRVYVGNTTDIGSQKRLDRMLAPAGADSVKAAIEADRTLGGVVDDLRVTRCSGYRVYSRAGMPNATVLGAEWDIEVID